MWIENKGSKEKLINIEINTSLSPCTSLTELDISPDTVSESEFKAVNSYNAILLESFNP